MKSPDEIMQAFKSEHPMTDKEAFEWHTPNIPDYKPEQRIIDDINMRIEYALRHLVTPPIKGEITRGKIRWRGIYVHTLIVDDSDVYNVELADNGNLQNIRFSGHALVTGFSVEPHIFQRDHEINLNFQGVDWQNFRSWMDARREEQFQRACEEYRAMRRSVEGKSHKEQLDAINKFRCGDWH